ncbi:hypothetical protein SMICM17S_10506 [Streptomyces microflavus]
MTTLGGRNWAVPFDAAPQVFYYRKDFFTEHGITPPTTWDGFREAAKQVRKAGPRTRDAAHLLPDGAVLKSGVSWRHLLYTLLHFPVGRVHVLRRDHVLDVRAGGADVPAVALALPGCSRGRTASSCTGTAPTRST